MPETYISQTGILRSYTEIEKIIFQQNIPEQLTEAPITIHNREYYPVTNDALFKIVYNENGVVKNTLATNITPICIDAEETFSYTTIIDGEIQTRELSNKQIQKVKPNPNVSEFISFDSGDITETARKAEKYVGYHPDVIPDTVLSLLTTSEDITIQQSLIAILQQLTPDRIEDVTEYTHHLTNLLAETNDEYIKRDITQLLVDIVRHNATQSGVNVSDVVEYTSTPNDVIRKNAFKIIYLIISDTEMSSNQHMKKISENGIKQIELGAGAEELEYIVKILAEIASKTPRVIQKELPLLVEKFSQSTNPDVLVALSSIFAYIADKNPAAVLSHINSICDSCENKSTQYEVKNNKANIASMLHGIAKEYPEETIEHIDIVSNLIKTSNMYAIHNVTGFFARLAITHPTQVQPYFNDIVKILENADAEYSEVHTNICIILSQLSLTDSQQDIVYNSVKNIYDVSENESVKSEAHNVLVSIENNQ